MSALTKLSSIFGWTKPEKTLREEKAPTSAEVVPIRSVISVAPPAPQKIADAERSRYYGLGKDVARRTRALKFDAGIYEALKEQVMAQAAADVIENFDPAQDQVDRRTLGRLQFLDERLEAQRDDADLAA